MLALLAGRSGLGSLHTLPPGRLGRGSLHGDNFDIVQEERKDKRETDAVSDVMDEKR